MAIAVYAVINCLFELEEYILKEYNFLEEHTQKQVEGDVLTLNC